MGALADIHGALGVQLNSLGIPVASENVAFTPTEQVNWVRPTFAPTDKHQASLGTTGYDRQDGIYMVDIFVPDGVGWKAAADIFYQLQAAFPRGGMLTQGSTTVRIKRTYRGKAQIEDDWYHVPATIEWTADLPPGG